MNTVITNAGPRLASRPAPLPRRPLNLKAQAALLDCLAGIELQHGHANAAERLAWRAPALREACQ